VEYAQFLEKQGQNSSAISEYKKALEIKPDSKIAQDGLNKLTKQASK
jgi:Tfp pilus assembly protein PilF